MINKICSFIFICEWKTKLYQALRKITSCKFYVNGENGIGPIGTEAALIKTIFSDRNMIHYVLNGELKNKK